MFPDCDTFKRRKPVIRQAGRQAHGIKNTYAPSMLQTCACNRDQSCIFCQSSSQLLHASDPFDFASLSRHPLSLADADKAGTAAQNVG